MSLLDFFKSKKEDAGTNSNEESVPVIDSTENISLGYYEGINYIKEEYFDGEKTAGELGAVVDSMPDHLRLRLRAYDAKLKTDLVEIIVGRFIKWILGKGLKLNSNPDKTVLKMFGINEDTQSLQEQIEAFFNLYAETEVSDFSENDWFHEKAKEAYISSFLGGDCLCIVRFSSNGPNIQVIDGEKIEDPFDESLKAEGNRIIKGVEVDNKGKHVAFYVRNDSVLDNSTELKPHDRIKARDSKGRLLAWMVYGQKHRIDHVRGVPVISSILEKINKLDRYTESSVKRKEEEANVVFAFEHDASSTGENILKENFSAKKNTQSTKTSYELAGKTENSLRQSTSGSVLNLPVGAKLSQLKLDGGEDFNVFQRSVFNFMCAAVGIPPEVALQLYEQNYSSSRAAINGWEYMNEIDRAKFAKKFYKPFYELWLEFWVYKGVVDSKPLLKAFQNRNKMVLAAYFKSSFEGSKMPHIDPLKEAKAVRTMLGDDKVPLISRSQAASMLNSGDWNKNMSKHLEEEKIAPKPKITENNGGKKGNNTGE